MDTYQNSTKEQNKNHIYNQKLLDVNNYYILKYKSESNILKLIIFFCGLALIGCVFFLKGLIGEALYIIYLGFIISIGVIYVIYNIYDLKYRDNQRFDEYEYGYMEEPGTDLSGIHVSGNKTNDNELDTKNDEKNKCI